MRRLGRYRHLAKSTASPRTASSLCPAPARPVQMIVDRRVTTSGDRAGVRLSRRYAVCLIMARAGALAPRRRRVPGESSISRKSRATPSVRFSVKCRFEHGLRTLSSAIASWCHTANSLNEMNISVPVIRDMPEPLLFHRAPSRQSAGPKSGCRLQPSVSWSECRMSGRHRTLSPAGVMA